jgi:hypothetical protein
VAELLRPDREQAVIASSRSHAGTPQRVFDHLQRSHLDPIGADERQGRDRNFRQNLRKGIGPDEPDGAAVELDRLPKRRGRRLAAGEAREAPCG